MQRTQRSSVAWLTCGVLGVALLGTGCSTQPTAGFAHPTTDTTTSRQVRSHVAIDDASWAASRQARLGVSATGAAALMGASSGPVGGGYATYARLHGNLDHASPVPSAFAEVPTP
ncbi:MAG: hypothetical protein AAGK09_06320 [Planctomycetota bacterium]